MASPRPLSTLHPTERMLGNAPAIAALRAQIRHLAPFDAAGQLAVPTVLLQGETGTGKGLVARVIHDSGPRARGPLIEVNCAAIPETLLEAELFGYEGGAFTDARRAKPGLFEAASGGTLFLDEIDTLPLTLQAKLLTAIETRQVRRLGAVAARVVDVKLVAATQAALRQQVAAGRFRADLYHRLAVIVLDLPPLRARGEDSVVLAHEALRACAAAHRLPPRRLSRAAEAWVLAYAWPGNVRELQHLMERVTLLSTEPLIGPELLARWCGASAVATSTPVSPPTEPALPEEAARLAEAIRQTGGNVLRAARLLGLSRDAVRYRLRKYGIPLPSPQLPAAPGDISSNGDHRPRVIVPPPAVPLRPEPVIGAGDGRAALVSQGADTTVSAPVPAPAPSLQWERKAVAVLAVELTWPEHPEHEALAYEPWTAAQQWEQTVAQTVRGFGGVLLQRAPSLFLGAFGVPATLEQLPQRAVQAGLAIRRLVADSTAHEGGPSLRQAVHWGPLLVDGGHGDPALGQVLAIGETLTRPVRLLGYTAPGEILVSPEVASAVEGWCTLEACEGPFRGEPADRVAAYALVGLRSQRSPLAMYAQRALSRFVGRERELATLNDLLTLVDSGRGQVVGVVGEPGVGKSRLCWEFLRAHQARDRLILEAGADSYSQATPYLPVIDLLKAFFQLDAGADRQAVRALVGSQLLALDEGLQPLLPALLVLLDGAGEDPQWQALEPPQRRRRLLEAVKYLLLRESQSRPLVVVVENLHWVDGETQACLDYLVDGLAAARVLLLVSFRPEYEHPWGGKTYYTQLRLDPLPPGSAAALLEALLGDGAGEKSGGPLQELSRRLIERTEGNPFFLEESVRHLIETQVLTGAPGAYRLSKPLHHMQIPAVVQTVLAARIDRLVAEDKRLLQTAAVIGKDVPFNLLQAMGERPAESLQDRLAHLQRVEFLHESRLLPEPVYTFKHALTHEMAYGSLLQGQRQVLHARIVEVLEALYADRLAEQVERLAYHALQGEAWDKALAYGRQSGEKALMRSAHREAVGYFEQALLALSHLPDQRDTREQAVDLRLALRTAVHVAGDLERVMAVLQEAEALATALDDPRRLGRVLTALTSSVYLKGAYDQTIAAAERALDLATASGDGVLQARANQALGWAYEALGDYRLAIECFERTVASLSGDRRHERFGLATLPAVNALACLARCHAQMGTFAEGIALGDESLQIAEAVAHPASLLFASCSVGSLFLRRGDLDRALPLLERAMHICHEADLPFYFTWAAATLGEAYTLCGRVTEAMPLLAQSVEQSTAMGSPHWEAFFHLPSGEAYCLSGRLQEAHSLLSRTLTLSRRYQQRGNEASALRLLGETAARRQPPEVGLVESYYRQALNLAEELGMRPLQAHCHLGLGTLCANIGRRPMAHDELSAAIELYRSMGMTFWLPQAERELGQGSL
jgi:DNA-binding NtrC family response regulator/tetratricopeptide (TPR) repeat protein